MVKFVWQKSGLWSKFLYAVMLGTFALNIIIFAAEPNLHQFIHAGLWLWVCFFAMFANYYRLAYEESGTVRRLGEDVDALLHVYGALLVKKDEDGYTITSFSDADLGGDS